MPAFGARLAAARRDAALTVEPAAAQLGVQRKTVVRWETGSRCRRRAGGLPREHCMSGVPAGCPWCAFRRREGSFDEVATLLWDVRRQAVRPATVQAWERGAVEIPSWLPAAITAGQAMLTAKRKRPWWVRLFSRWRV